MSRNHHHHNRQWRDGTHRTSRNSQHKWPTWVGYCDTQAPLARARLILGAIARAACPRRTKHKETTPVWADISSPEEKLQALGVAQDNTWPADKQNAAHGCALVRVFL